MKLSDEDCIYIAQLVGLCIIAVVALIVILV